jgi:probable F420-dependent oxidoreductase
MTPAAVIEAARRAEEMGYDSLWALERLLYPTDPRSKYPVTPDGSLPPMYTRVLTPIETLTYVAAHTSKIGLGTSVLVMPLHNPIMLARQLATLDVLSGGRLQVGLGQGWSVDEVEAAGGQMTGRASRADEFIRVLKAVWSGGPVNYAGEHFRLPRSILQPKPIQSPHPPILLGGESPAVLDRTGRLADGWMPAGAPLTATWQMMARVREAARAAGRDPKAVNLVLFAFPKFLDESPGEARPDFVGTYDEIRRDVATARDLGASEIIFAPGYATGDLCLKTYMEGLERLQSMV